MPILRNGVWSSGTNRVGLERGPGDPHGNLFPGDTEWLDAPTPGDLGEAGGWEAAWIDLGGEG